MVEGGARTSAPQRAADDHAMPAPTPERVGRTECRGTGSRERRRPAHGRRARSGRLRRGLRKCEHRRERHQRDSAIRRRVVKHDRRGRPLDVAKSARKRRGPGGRVAAFLVAARTSGRLAPAGCAVERRCARGVRGVEIRGAAASERGGGNRFGSAPCMRDGAAARVRASVPSNPAPHRLDAARVIGPGIRRPSAARPTQHRAAERGAKQSAENGGQGLHGSG